MPYVFLDDAGRHVTLCTANSVTFPNLSATPSRLCIPCGRVTCLRRGISPGIGGTLVRSKQIVGALLLIVIAGMLTGCTGTSGDGGTRTPVPQLSTQPGDG